MELTTRGLQRIDYLWFSDERELPASLPVLLFADAIGKLGELFSKQAITEMESDDDSDGFSGGDCEGYMLLGASFASSKDREALKEPDAIVFDGAEKATVSYDEADLEDTIVVKEDGTWKLGPEG